MQDQGLGWRHPRSRQGGDATNPHRIKRGGKGRHKAGTGAEMEGSVSHIRDDADLELGLGGSSRAEAAASEKQDEAAVTVEEPSAEYLTAAPEEKGRKFGGLRLYLGKEMHNSSDSEGDDLMFSNREKGHKLRSASERARGDGKLLAGRHGIKAFLSGSNPEAESQHSSGANGLMVLECSGKQPMDLFEEKDGNQMEVRRPRTRSLLHTLGSKRHGQGSIPGTEEQQQCGNGSHVPSNGEVFGIPAGEMEGLSERRKGKRKQAEGMDRAAGESSSPLESSQSWQSQGLLLSSEDGILERGMRQVAEEDARGEINSALVEASGGIDVAGDAVTMKRRRRELGEDLNLPNVVGCVQEVVDLSSQSPESPRLRRLSTRAPQTEHRVWVPALGSRDTRDGLDVTEEHHAELRRIRRSRSVSGSTRNARVRFGANNQPAWASPTTQTSIDRREQEHSVELFDLHLGEPLHGRDDSEGIGEGSNSSLLQGTSAEEPVLAFGRGEGSSDLIDLANDLSPPNGRFQVERLSLFPDASDVAGGRGAGSSQAHISLSESPEPGPINGTSERAGPQWFSRFGREALQDMGEGSLRGNEDRIFRLDETAVQVDPSDLRRSRAFNMGAPSNNSSAEPEASSNLPVREGIGQPGRSFPSSASRRLGFSVVRRRPHRRIGSRSGLDGRVVRRDLGMVPMETDESLSVGTRAPGTNIDCVALQVAGDERLARELQQAESEAVRGDQPWDDEILARMLQQEENAHVRGLPLGPSATFHGTGTSRIHAVLGEMENQRVARRLLQSGLVRAQAERVGNPGSSSRAARMPGHGRSSTVSGLRARTAAVAASNGEETSVTLPQFPSNMALEMRLEVLAALEMAFQEQLPLGLQLAHVDRDFNENDYEMLLALDADNGRHRGASREAIAQLPTMTIPPTDVSEDGCSICLEVRVAGDIFRLLPCMHTFHQQCIDKWLQRQAVCPICKAHI